MLALPSQRHRGFTLAELLIVLAVLAVLMASAGPALEHTVAMVRLKSSARQLAALLRHAAESAILSGQGCAVVLEKETGRYWLASARSGIGLTGLLTKVSPEVGGALPAGVVYRTVQVEDVPGNVPGAVYFLSEGAATIAAVVLETPGQTPCYRIEVSGRGKVRVVVEN